MHITRMCLRGREHGQVAVLFGLLLPVIFGIGMIVMNVGNWYVHKRHLQTQVDAAVLASAPSFSGCFHDQAIANAGVSSTALSYAGDTARKPTTNNQQIQKPGAVRVTLNSQRYWNAGDPAVPTLNGYGTPTDPVGDNSAGYPCSISSLDAKATDEDVPSLFRLLAIFPDIKTHAKVEILRVREAMGFLPLAVPEIDPNYAYAIFVDYAENGTQVPIKVQELAKAPTYGGSGFLYSTWVTRSSVAVPGNESVSVHPDATFSDGTGVVILVSKDDTPPSTSGTLNGICNQTPVELVQCYAGTGAAYDGAANGQGLAFIHSFATSTGNPANPLLRDVNLGATVCIGGIGAGNLSPPYFINDDADCSVGFEVKVDFGVTGDPRPGLDQTPAGICAEVNSNAGQLTYVSTSGTISTWRGSMTVPSVGGPQILNLTYRNKTAPLPPAAGSQNCNSPNNSGALASPGAMSYSANDASGPVGFVKLTATGPNGSTSCPGGSTVSDANSVERGNFCYTVAVGLDRPLALVPWSTPSLVMRFASKAARKGGSGTANLNGSLLCDRGRTLEATFTTGCYTTYGLNYDKWGTAITPTCSPGAFCWKDVLCSAYSPSDLPPLSTVNNPPPICVAAKGGQVQAFQAGVYNRFEAPANGYGGCTPNHWPTTQAQADQFFKPVEEGGHDFTDDPRFVTLVVTDNTAFSAPNVAEPIKYFAGFYVTGWDTNNGAGKPKGCYDYPPGVGTCGAPNNDAHPILGCLAGVTNISTDNGDLWGHFVKFVEFSSSANPSEDLCTLTSASTDTCVAVLVE